MDLSTDYLAFTLPHPLMAGASPLADDLGGTGRNGRNPLDSGRQARTIPMRLWDSAQGPGARWRAERLA